MPSRQLTDILALVPPDFADPDADYRAVRAMLAPFHGHPVPAHIAVTEVEIGGVRCAWYEDGRQPRRERVVFHCHGGGLVSCQLDDYHFYGAMLAEQLEARVVDHHAAGVERRAPGALQVEQRGAGHLEPDAAQGELAAVVIDEREPERRQVTLVDEGVGRHDLDAGDAERRQMRDHRGLCEPGEPTARGFRDIAPQPREAAQVQLVENGAVPFDPLMAGLSRWRRRHDAFGSERSAVRAMGEHRGM